MLERSAHVHEYPDARIIINEGDPGSSLFIVVAGLLEVSQRDAAGKPRAIGRLIPGDVFGEISLLTGMPRIATITALTPVTLIEIDKEHLQSLFDADPDMVARLTDIEASRLLANRNALQVPVEEQATIDRIGTAEFLRQRILQFFGRGPR